MVEANAQAARRQTMMAERAAELDRGARRRSTVGQLSQVLQSGEADESHIARALYRGEIDGEDAQDLRARLVRFDEERSNRADEIDGFDIAVKSGLSGGGDAIWNAETVDRWWAMERERGTALPRYIPDCFGVSRHIPQPYIDDLRKMILSTSAEESVLAGREFRDLREQSVDAADAVLGRLPDREARDLEVLADYAHLDLPPGRIEELSQEQGRKKPRDGSVEYQRDDYPHSRGNVVIGDPPPTTNEPVDLDEYHKALDYREEGDGEAWNFIKNVVPSGKWDEAMRSENEGIADAWRVQREYGLSDWETDAFRHAKWQYTLSGLLGTELAKKVGDAHERRSWREEELDLKEKLGLREKKGSSNPPGDALMDLYNNHVGRQIYEESRGKSNIDIDSLIVDALRSGRLQLRPFNLRDQ